MHRIFPGLLLLLATSVALIGAERVPWTTSRVLGSPDQPPKFRLERSHGGLNFTNPIDIAYSRELDRWFVGDQAGRIFSFDDRGEHLSLAADLAPLQGREGTFYALTFDPDFRANAFVYLCYAQKSDLPDGSKVSRFKVTTTGEPRIDLASEEVLITWLSGGHNGACLRFGNDGYLYISTGDAAGPNPPDPLKTGQDVTDLLSSVLRIDVHNQEAGKHYRIPPDNPFAGHPKARPEIWAYGFRNPWRMGFDGKTGDLWVADVGWELWELIYKVERGGNYGWSIVEGRQPVLPNDPVGPTPILPPIKDHPHGEAASVTGGPVYYGKRFPELTGAFIYGDWETGKIWAIRAKGNEVDWSEELADSGTRIIAFGEDRDGEVFVLDYNGGIYALVENPAATVPQNFPTKLSETGLFTSLEKLDAAPGVYLFEVNAPMWNDFGQAQRWIALPGESTINTRERPWRYPSNAVLARTITLEMERGNPKSARRIETQLLHFTGDGWGAYSYRWNDAQTDAELVAKEGADELLKVKDATVPSGVRLQPWRFASRTECLRCHNSWCGTALGFQPEQIGKQMAEFENLKLVAAQRRRGNRDEESPQLVSPYDSGANLEARARSWLHVNCSACHRENAGGSVPSVLNFELPLDKMRAVDARPVLGDLGLTGGKVIAPGDPFHSVLLFRVSATGRSRMPYIGSELIDDEGIAVLRDWIASMNPRASVSARRPGGGTPSGGTSSASPESFASPALLKDGSDTNPKTTFSAPDAGTREARPSGTAREDARPLAGLTEFTHLHAQLSGDAKQFTQSHLANTSTALMLAHALSEPNVSVTAKEQIARIAAKNTNPLIVELFERFLPAEARSITSQTIAPREQILALRGDAQRGAALLHDTARMTCLQCHQFQGAGRAFGPDLKSASKNKTRGQILDAILQPSKEIAPEYILHAVESENDEFLSGIIVRRTPDRIILRDATGFDHELPANKVKSVRPQQLSAMPEGLLAGLSAQQIADLLEALTDEGHE